MENIIVEEHGDIAVLRLSNGVTNAINGAIVHNLSEALDEIENSFRGLVLAGGEKFFSIGFDLPTILLFTPSEMAEFFADFNALSAGLYTCGIPTCCALRGHATAGGCILALACDYRIAASGRKLIGLNEAKLSVPVPYFADLLLRQLVDDRTATDMLYTGEFVTSLEAEQVGLVDFVCDQEEVERRAIEEVQALMTVSGSAFKAMKSNRAEAVIRQYDRQREAKDRYFLDCWFSDEAQMALKAASAKF
jgi:enoyl-CoA hydratase/carnithine racemase